MRMDVAPRIGSSVVRGLLLPLAEQGVAAELLLEECEISQAVLDDPEGKIFLQQYFELINLAAERAADPLLGLKLARSAGPETLGILGFLFLSSPSLLEAIKNCCHYLGLFQDVTNMHHAVTDGLIHVTYDIQSYRDHDTRQDVEFSIALTLRLFRIYAGQEIEFEHVTFRHSPSANVADYRALLKVPVFFEQDCNSIVFPSRFGDLKGTVVHESLSSILKGTLDRQRELRSRSGGFTTSVNNALYELGTNKALTAGRVAKHLGVSQATFFRKLAKEGATFQALIDEHKVTIAKDYLRDSNLSVTQIGQMLGFAETASFSRAFSRWNDGITPSAFRKEFVAR